MSKCKRPDNNTEESNTVIYWRDQEINPRLRCFPLELRPRDYEPCCKEVLLLCKYVELEAHTFSAQQSKNAEKSHNKKGRQQSLDNSPTDGVQENLAFDEYKRKETFKLHIGIDLITGKIQYFICQKNSVTEFVEFLKIVDKYYPKESVIYMVLEKRRIYSSKEAHAFLDTRRGRFQFIFAPKQMSWLKLIEMFFDSIMTVMMPKIQANSRNEIRERIQYWLDAYN